VARRAAGAGRARAELERFTGTNRAAGPNVTAEVTGRSDSDCVVRPGMSAWPDEAAGAAEGRERAGDDGAAGVAGRPARVTGRCFACAGRGARVAAGRGLAGGAAAGVRADFALPVGLG